MVILLQGTFTPLVHAHAGRTKLPHNRAAELRRTRLCAARLWARRYALRDKSAD
ncbi:hypothetical protein [Microbulbifer sp. A4B17]|uniref:hypothetical protein n=1 Tax=Microbulbifer sp. A4B17 TaxID=359370 RepID=UPI00130041B8|nr:hypothetical protein [Microbulbifer sp. A4B17]